MPNLKLTDTERLLLANQYEILAHLREDDDLAQLAKNLRSGHEWIYKQAFEDLYPVLSEEDTKFVLDVLRLYDDLRVSKGNREDAADIDDDKLEFPGFDANDGHENTLRGFCEALRLDGRYLAVLGDEAPNSHMTMVDAYNRMLDARNEIPTPYGQLSKEELSTVLNARYGR